MPWETQPQQNYLSGQPTGVVSEWRRLPEPSCLVAPFPFTDVLVHGTFLRFADGQYTLSAVQEEWWITQMMTSPLRTQNATEAVFVFVPLRWKWTGDDEPVLQECSGFMESAQTTLPLLKSKPHLAVLNHPINVLPQCYNHADVQYFTFISLEPGLNTETGSAPHLVLAPLISHVHWHMGSDLYHRNFSLSNIDSIKTRLAYASFKVRSESESRKLGFQGCSAVPHRCLYHDYNTEDELTSSVQAHEGYQSAYFTIMPRGEPNFLIRNSLYDALLSVSIPVLLDKNYKDYLPFQDIIQWDDLVVQVGMNKNFMGILQKQYAHKTVLLNKLEKLFTCRHVFQYALDPDHHLVSFDQRHIVSSFDDAFTFTLKAVLRTWCHHYDLPDC